MQPGFDIPLPEEGTGSGFGLRQEADENVSTTGRLELCGLLMQPLAAIAGPAYNGDADSKREMMDAPRRILYICHDGDLYGSQQSLSLMVAHLPTDRYRAFVSIARPGPLNERLNALPNVTVLSHRRLQWVKHDRRSSLKRLGDILTLLVGLPFKAMALAKTIREHEIDLVHTNASVSLEGALAARLAGVPHVWHIRELFMEENPKLHMVLGRAFSRWTIDRLSDRVLCISEAVARQFTPYREKTPEKYVTIYNALAPSDPPDTSSPHRLSWPEKHAFRLGYIGRLSSGKRFSDLLEAVALLREKGLEIELCVAGNFVDRDYEEQIQATLQSCHLSAIVHLLGYLDDTRPLLDTLDLLVLPSLNEPFGRVLIEAMLAGVPCLAANSGGVPEIITDGETGWLYPPKDTRALADQIAALMDDPARVDAVRQNAGRQAGERFTIEKQIRTLEACYQSTLERRR